MFLQCFCFPQQINLKVFSFHYAHKITESKRVKTFRIESKMQWAPNLCRICGCISETCHEIHQKDNMEVEHKLKKCLNLDVYREDYKPKQICNSCFIKLNEYNDFIELCNMTNMRFESMLMNKEDWPDENTVPDYSQQQKRSVIVTSKSVPDTFGCPDIDLYKDSMLPLENLDVPSCSMNDQAIIDIVENSNSYGNGLAGDMTYIAPNYDKSYSNYYNESNSVLHHSSDYQLPVDHCNSDTSVVTYQNKSIETQVTAAKSDCSNYYYNYTEPCTANLPIDFASNNPKEKEPEVTQQVEKPAKVSRMHNRSTNKLISVEAIRNYIIPHPDFTCPRKAKKGNETFVCSHCDKKFMRRITLKAHMAIHTKLRPFICDVCGKSFAVRSDLSNHQRAHTDEYRCKHCQKGFSVPSKLQRHLRTHTNHRPFVCNFKNCGLAFSDKRNLDGHKHTHSDERNFKCNECGKSFKTKNLLKDHSRAHSDKLQYKCTTCGKEYKWKANLLAHKKKHDGYFCPYCKKDCGKASNLNKHKKECRTKCGLY